MPAESVFICYRRDDSGETAGRIFDRLTRDLPAGSVFRDLDSIPLGVDFREHVKAKLAEARVVLVLIGPDWLTIRDAQRQRRLDDAADHVRVEVETALHTAGLPVIPILCRHAAMPRAKDLPEPMLDLAFKNGQAVRPDPDFHHDVDRLVKHIRRILDTPLTTPKPPSPPAVIHTEAEKPAPAPASAKKVEENAKVAETTPAPVKQQVEAAKPPLEKKDPPKPLPPPWQKTAKDVATIALGLLIWGLILWGGFVGIRYAWGKASEGIAWAKQKFTNPTPTPQPFHFPTPKPSLFAPTPTLSERVKMLFTPTPPATSTGSALKTGSELPKLSSPFGKPTPTPFPFLFDPASGKMKIELPKELTPTPNKPYGNGASQTPPDK